LPLFSGASGGLGLETTRILALRGVHVVMAVGNVKNGLSIKETLPKEIPNAKIDVFELDISSLASVSKLAADFNSFYNLI
jgi:WW domain-containing oxidoreductase